MTAAQVRAKVDKLYQDAEAATEKYNGAKEKADHASATLRTLHDEAARKTMKLNSARKQLGWVAASQYREGGLDPAVQLALSDDPVAYLQGAEFAERAGHQQSTAIANVRKELREIKQIRDAADVEVTTLKSRQAELKTRKKTINGKLEQAKRLLDRLSAPERAAVVAGGTGHAAGGRASRSSSDARGALPATGTPGSPSAASTPAPATDSRAAAAVAYAYSKLGSPYVWGATGPNAFDCSGLVQAAYRSAGVSLPRTTYAQINAGTRVSRSELQPGDLVFFYSGISHVGIYVGNGQMVHAPNPSAPVRVAPVDEMPFAGATRVA